MKIGTRERLATTMLLAVIGIIALAVWWTFAEVKDAGRQRREASEIARSLSALRLATLEYALSHQEPARKKWFELSQKADGVIASVRFSGAAERETLARIGDRRAEVIRLLMVEDSEDDAALLLRALKQGGFDVQYERVYSAAALKEALAERQWDAVVSDFRMPGFTGLDALRIYRSTGLDIPFMLISGTIGEETAVQAMKGGASDYIMKQSLARLAPALERELKETQARAAHRRDQEALADSETRFRQMAETIRDVFFLINAERTQMLYVSPAYEDIWGQSCKDLYANPESWTAAIHPDDRTAVYNNYQRHIGSPEQELEDQYRIVRPDGTIRWIESRAFPVHDTDGRIVRIAGVAKDITDRMNAAQELRESERRFSDMLGNVELVSLMLDRESRITYCNDYPSPGARAIFAPSITSGRWWACSCWSLSRSSPTSVPKQGNRMKVKASRGVVRGRGRR